METQTWSRRPRGEGHTGLDRGGLGLPCSRWPGAGAGPRFPVRQSLGWSEPSLSDTLLHQTL